MQPKEVSPITDRRGLEIYGENLEGRCSLSGPPRTYLRIKSQQLRVKTGPCIYIPQEPGHPVPGGYKYRDQVLQVGGVSILRQ
jgi:hypothetical protein